MERMTYSMDTSQLMNKVALVAGIEIMHELRKMNFHLQCDLKEESKRLSEMMRNVCAFPLLPLATWRTALPVLGLFHRM